MSNAYPGASAGPLYSCWLSSGGMLSVRPDRIEVGQDSYPVMDLMSATLIANPSILAAPGTFTGAAVYLGLRSGKSLALVPTNYTDSWRALEALYAVRPELADDIAAHSRPGCAARWVSAGLLFRSRQ